MGNELQKQYNIKEKPLKLPGSYNFLKFIHHPTQPLSLIIVKHPHKATPIPSTLILPLQSVKTIGQNDSLATCKKCLPLCLVKPKSQIQMKIIMHKLIKAGSQIGRCFLYQGRVVLWCQQKRGIASLSPQQLEHGKSHQKSRVFTSGMALINFLHCAYQPSLAKKDKQHKKQLMSIKDKVKQKLKEKEKVNESLPQQIKLFFDPKDKKEYYDQLYSMNTKLRLAPFWQAISEGLRQLLLNMINQEPDKRIDLQLIANIPYFMQSNQLRLYSTLTDQLQTISHKQAKIFMTSLEMLIKQGLTIQVATMRDFFNPVLHSMVTYNQQQGKENDKILPLVLSILIQLDRPDTDVINHGFRKAHAKNIVVSRLALTKKSRLFQIMPTDSFDFILSSCLFSIFQSDSNTLEAALSNIPYAMKHIKAPNFRKQIEYKLIHNILVYPVDKIKQSLLLTALKCTIHLLKQNLITSVSKLEILIYPPQKMSMQVNFHVLYLYGLMIELLNPLQLLQKMMPKLQLYLNDLQLNDQIFVVAKRCVDRMLQRLYQQRKIKPSELVQLQKDEMYFQLSMPQQQLTNEIKKNVLKKEVEKHQLQSVKWIVDLL